MAAASGRAVAITTAAGWLTGVGSDTGDPDATPERCGTVLCAGEVGMLAGPGEAGKSTVAVALTRAAREGGAACGLHVARARVAVLSYEDSGPPARGSVHLVRAAG